MTPDLAKWGERRQHQLLKRRGEIGPPHSLGEKAADGKIEIHLRFCYSFLAADLVESEAPGPLDLLGVGVVLSSVQNLILVLAFNVRRSGGGGEDEEEGGEKEKRPFSLRASDDIIISKDVFPILFIDKGRKARFFQHYISNWRGGRRNDGWHVGACGISMDVLLLLCCDSCGG